MTQDSDVATGDWIPGEAGWIENNFFHVGVSSEGTEGENIVYMGNSVFWGNWSGGGRTDNLQGWLREVASWDYKWWHIRTGSSLHSNRFRPKL